MNSLFFCYWMVWLFSFGEAAALHHTPTWCLYDLESCVLFLFYDEEENGIVQIRYPTAIFSLLNVTDVWNTVTLA